MPNSIYLVSLFANPEGHFREFHIKVYLLFDFSIMT
jgi:hypothetical protein